MRSSLAVMLLSSILAPAAVYASDVPAASQPVRITTGLVAPVVLNSGHFAVSSDALNNVLLPKPAVVLALKVTEKGTAEDVRVVKSVNPKVDQQVLAAVRDFHFRPATLDHTAIPVDLQLTVLVQR